VGGVTDGGSAVANRFADPADEKDYRRSVRRERRPTTYALIGIALAVFVAMSLFNPLLFAGATLIFFNLVVVAMIGALVAAVLIVRTDLYLDHLWLDALMFAAMAAAMALITDALGDRAAVIGMPKAAIVVINSAMLLAFASVTFVGNWRWFLPWAALFLLGASVFVFAMEGSLLARAFVAANILVFTIYAGFVAWDADRRARALFVAGQLLAQEKAKTEELLYNVLPQPVANRIRAGEAVADSFADVSVIFVDIVGFSVMAKRMSPGHLVQELNHLFLMADECAARHGVEKVKTIGDAYLAVAGGTASAPMRADNALAFAADLIGRVRARGAASNVDYAVRVGIHTGPVVGGVVGTSRLAYDYWGDTMNIASRIEGVAEPNGIAASAATFAQASRSWRFGPPEAMTLKGVGDTLVYRIAPADVAASAEPA